ncbi:hypothetical protein TRVL_01117 [Trypanosoma vivax]|uniref:B30.2/SPRY domain-containing protein n=1 Tax=Trypanosoma vivax (strain Y486) TaxID=1055687 RepID=G0U712_TRYVY|nr:hypothetical protein TRVL_01117 [Trypanosoma vivax]CCC51669.1 conserved hypothetical protein [Trypanosoma vivax Y486]
MNEKYPAASVTFTWKRAAHVYAVNGAEVIYRGDTGPYLPVIGDLNMPPDSGKYFYEIRTNCFTCKVGVCAVDTFPEDVELQSVELGGPPTVSGRNSTQPNLHHCLLFNCQSSMVELNGSEVKSLWKLFVPTSGARFGFLVDTNEGIVKLYVNDVYGGIIADPTTGLKGVTLCPCIALVEVALNNAIVEGGRLGAFVSPPRKLDEFNI